MLNKGIIENITNGTTWREVSDCAGKSVPKDCKFRAEEMQLVVYTPIECYNREIQGCEEIQSYARFDIGSHTRAQSRMNIIITFFVGIILAVASVAFA